MLQGQIFSNSYLFILRLLPGIVLPTLFHVRAVVFGFQPPPFFLCYCGPNSRSLVSCDSEMIRFFFSESIHFRHIKSGLFIQVQIWKWSKWVVPIPRTVKENVLSLFAVHPHRCFSF